MGGFTRSQRTSIMARLMRSEAVPAWGGVDGARSAPARALAFCCGCGQVEAAAEQGFDEALGGGLFFGAACIRRRRGKRAK